jgi:uncharacterized repeat protein (TIGR01451 family)
MTFVSSTELQVALTAADVAAAGTGQIVVVNPSPGGGSSNAMSLAINNPSPQVTSVSPSTVNTLSAGSTLTITGSGFIAASTLTWNGATHAATYVSSTQLQLTLAASDVAAVGSEQIAVVNPAPGGGSSTAVSLAVNYPSPQISGISPSSVTTLCAGSTVTITGSGFISASTVTWSGTTHTDTYVSGTELQITLLASDVAAVGSAQIAVVNPTPGGGTSTASTLTIGYPVPAISSLSPSSVAWGLAGIPLTVNGTGFVASSVVQLNGVNHATTYVNATTLTLTLSSGDLGAATTLSVTVVTPSPGGGTSAPVSLPITYVAPTLAEISPTSITVNSPATMLAIYGTGLTPASTVQVNGTTLNVIIDVVVGGSSSYLVVTLPPTDLTSVGALSITVANPGTASSNALTFNVTANPAPTLSNISPSSASIGGAGFTLTLSGSNFVPASVVQWNGSARPTTFVSSSELTATIYAADIQSLGNYNVTVSNPSPGGGVSPASLFTTYIALAANDLVYDPTTQLLYASVPSAGGSVLGNSIVPIDPYTGVLGSPVWVGSEPALMALSSDGSTIWVSLNGAGAVREMNVSTQTAGLQFGLGGGTGIYNGPANAAALAVLPGFPNTVAVAGGTTDTYSSLVTIYDSGVARANSLDGAIQCCSGVTGLEFDPTGTMLYEAGSGYGVATVNSTGITSATSLNTSVSTTALDVDTGRAYLTSGVVLNANTGTQLGVFSSQGENASGPVATDSTLGNGFVLVNSFNAEEGEYIYGINVYNLSSFVLNGSIPVSGVDSFLQTPSALTRWGQNGLAFITGSQLYILTSPLVQNLSSSLADVSVTASAPAAATTGTNMTYGLTVSNAGPLAATPATLVDTLPSGATLQSVTPSQGNCSSGAVISCDLGNLNSGSSATVQITLTPLTAATLTNTAVVSSPEADPNPANNTVVSTTIVTGVVYAPAPAVTSIAPAFVQAGSSSFTLTVNGSGFATNSAVQLNSISLPTTLVSSTQLTATVPASAVASLGWAWVNVTNPAPGGGTSGNLPLTTYSVVSLDINRMAYDPYTRKLYATIPSTATQVTGNSLVAIDPTTGSLSTPLNIGSGPNRISESSDGQYFFIGLDGAESLTNVNLTTMVQGPVFPLKLPGSGTQFAARDLAVVPGDDNLLAVDTGEDNGIGMLDISGSTAAMRPTLTGTYTGSWLTFGNSTTLYSYDTDTSGALFRIWTVGSSGLTLNNNTGYTIDGMGGFSGAYQLVNGIVYGFGGGVANLDTLPPTQLGQCEIASAQGSGQLIEGSGVSANPTYGRIFYLGETEAGSANPVLFSYDSNRYVLLAMQQFTGAAQGEDLLRWGRDGLAWHSSLSGAFGNSTPGSGQLFLMRGPFVLPEWNTVNATPSLSSASPTSVSAGSGNFILTVTGSGFVPGAVLEWNGAERTATFVNSSQLTVAIPAADVSQAGTATLVVNNPGSNNSSSISFSIN